MSKIWNDLKSKLEFFSRPFPQAAIDLAYAHREEVTPYLLACLEATATDPSAATDSDYMLHLYAMHLLAYWRETQAYRPMAQLGHHSEDVVEALMGDLVTESYDHMLASVCDGDLGVLEALAEDKSASIWARGAALKAMVLRAINGDADREAVIAYLRARGACEAERLQADRSVMQDVELIDTVVICAVDLGAASMLPLIEQWHAANLLDTSIIREAEIARQIIASPDACRERLSRRGSLYTGEVGREMGSWAAFADEPEAMPAPDPALFAPPPYAFDTDPGRPQTIVRETAKIGRNEPCPCGSGLKYKKCHGA